MSSLNLVNCAYLIYLIDIHLELHLGFSHSLLIYVTNNNTATGAIIGLTYDLFDDSSKQFKESGSLAS